jgi:hypothetical protein
VLNNVLSLQLSQLLPITAGNTDVPAMDRSWQKLTPYSGFSHVPARGEVPTEDWGCDIERRAGTINLQGQYTSTSAQS